MSRWLRMATAAGTLMAVAGAAHALWNVRHLERPTAPTDDVTDRVGVLIPARNEAGTVAATVRSALHQQGVPDLEVHLLDDGSQDSTAAQAAQAAGPDARFRLHRGEDAPPPPGWLGKPWACQRLADAAGQSDVLVFVDADVQLNPQAVAAATSHLRETGAAMVSPWPQQLAGTWLERLVQPIQQWSWITTLPLPLARSSSRASLAAANGQFLVIDAAAYRSIGGHGAVAGEVLEDIGMARAMKSAGYTTDLVDGSQLAACRMYEDAGEVIAGYSKSLWAAFGRSQAGPMERSATTTVALSGLTLAYMLPPTAALVDSDHTTTAIGLLGYGAAVVGRTAAAEATGGRVWPDSLFHPISILALDILAVTSLTQWFRGGLTWKDRPLPSARAV